MLCLKKNILFACQVHTLEKVCKNKETKKYAEQYQVWPTVAGCGYNVA